MRRSLFCLTALFLLDSSASAFQDTAAGMLRYPDVSAESIVFVYANDLWLVSRNGGIASPLASPAGAERAPKFNIDGTRIAFNGNYEGNPDLYTTAVAGGLPSRVTHHPGYEMLWDWGSDGRLLFSTSAMAGIARAPKMYSVAETGGLPQEFPVPYGQNGSLHSDGKRLAYTPNARDNRNWKRYRGGTASDVWIMDLESKQSRRVTDWEGTDTIPMWHGDTLYYASDRGPAHRLNIWKFTADGRHAQVTEFTDYDIKWPSIGPGDKGQGEIVFQNGSGIVLLDLASEVSRVIDVQVPGVRDSLRPQRIDTSDFIASARLSASGKRAVVEARGDIWTLPAKDGTPRNLTRSGGVAERAPSWSPDGRWVAYLSDRSGEYEVWITQSDGQGETRQLTKDTEGYKYDPTWSPDSNKIAFSDRSGSIFIHDLKADETKFVARHEAAEWGVPVRWSGDSRWLTWSHVGASAGTSSIFVHDSTSGENRQLTSDMFSDDSPVFDRKGDYLYFVSGRNFRGQKQSAIDSNYVYEDNAVLLAVPLREDVENPWIHESDEEEWDGEDSETEDEESENDDDAADEDEDSADDSDSAADDGISGSWSGSLSIPEMGELTFTMTLELDNDGSLSGSVDVPEMGESGLSGTYDAESKTASGTISSDDGDSHSFDGSLGDGELDWVVDSPGGSAQMKGSRAAASEDTDEDADEDEATEGKKKKSKKKDVEPVEIDFEGFERRALALPVKAGSFRSLAVNDKNQLLYARRGEDGGVKLFDLHADDPKETDVCTGRGFGLSADGKQLMLMRDQKPAIGKATAGSSPKSVITAGMDTRIDPSQEWPQLFDDTWRLYRDYFYAGNMHGVDWKAIHAQYRPMITACVSRNDVDFVLREMIAELNCGHTYVNGGPMERGSRVGVGLLGCDFTLEEGAYRIKNIVEGGIWDSDSRGPLSQHGVDVNEGDWLLAVNSIALDPAQDPWAAFVGLAGTIVELTVHDKPTLDDNVRRVRVKTIGSENSLRYRAWIESNRAHVFEQSNGRVGYIYVPNTTFQGRNDLFRQLYGQAHLDALIIDERWNAGGQFPNREVEALDRPRTNYWARRWGRSWPTPADSHQGPKCMLINRDAGSGGDMFPYLFKQAGLGKLIGTRTWGGLVGYSGSPQLIDGASLAIPSFGFYELDGSWGVEGHGVAPDIEVMDDPALMQDGGDPQLDAAIAQMLEELKTNAYQPPARPEMPDRSGMGLPESDRNQFPEGGDR
ncbi:MAG: tricorn protease-like protein/C-terminal processing protease CtpA/Prc [Planctomycetota bacterium]|jgi:tricorn protease-like protein/C-terminal processing protease CtpA/Prc